MGRGRVTPYLGGMRGLPPSFALTVLACGSAVAQDTFSIVAVDLATGQVGSAGATCLDDNQIAGGAVIISDVIPDIGAIHTQSYWIPANQNAAHDQVVNGLSPEELMAWLEDNDAENNPAVRQYGMADLVTGTARAQPRSPATIALTGRATSSGRTTPSKATSSSAKRSSPRWRPGSWRRPAAWPRSSWLRCGQCGRRCLSR